MPRISVGPVLTGSLPASQRVTQVQAHTYETHTHTRHTQLLTGRHTHVPGPTTPPPPHTHMFICTRVHTHEPGLCSCRLHHSSSLGGALAALGKASLCLKHPTLATGELKIASLGPRCLSGCSAPCRQVPASERTPAPAPRGGAGLRGWLQRVAVSSGTQI